MAKKVIYECDLCNLTRNMGQLNLFRRRKFTIWDTHYDIDNFYICDHCLEEIRKKVRSEV